MSVKKLEMLFVFLAVCLMFAACDAQSLDRAQTLSQAQQAGSKIDGGIKTANGFAAGGETTSEGGAGAAADQARTVVQSYSMQTAGSSGITQQSQAFLTLYSDHTFTFQIQMYDGYPTVDGEYEATESGYTLIPKSTTVQSLPLETLGEIRMEKEGEHLLYKGSQLNGIFSGAVFVPCILSDEN